MISFVKSRLILFLAAFAASASSFSSDNIPVNKAALQRLFKNVKLDELKQAAPDFTYVDDQGRSQSLSQLKGRAVLLHFWASWCEPCKKELPDLVRLSGQLDGKRWVFLPVEVEKSDQREKALKFLQGLQPAVPFYQLSGDTKSADKYQTWGLPVTYIITRKAVF